MDMELNQEQLRNHLVQHGVDEAAANTLYEEEEPDYTCSQCQIPIKGGLLAFQRHLRRVDHVPPYVCGHCTSAYTLRPSLYQHLRDKHKEGTVQEQPTHQLVEEECFVQFVQQHVPVPENLPCVVEDDDDYGPPLDRREAVNQTLRRSAELAVLRMRSITYMTGVAIEKVQDECFSLMQHTALCLKQEVLDFFSKSNITPDEGLLNDLLANFSLSDPFEHVKTKPQQIAIFKKRFGLMEAEEIFLGARLDSRQHSKRPCLVPTQVNKSFQYMSIVKILQCVMSDPYLRGLIMSERKSDDGYLRSFCDASLYDELPQDLKGAIRIILYIDDLELLQALSAKRGNYKMAGIYFGIQNLPPELNALLTYIFVTALAFAEDAKFTEVWDPLLKDMKLLETEGAEVIIDGNSCIFKAVLVAKIGDDLAAHEVLGFVGPGGASCFCRACYITRKEMWKDGTKLGLLRSPARHQEDVRGAQNLVVRQATGVRAPSLIKGLTFFEPVRNSIFDIFHDLQQGVCKMEVKLALREYVCIKKYFTVQQLKSRIHFFDYGLPDMKNKPMSGLTADYLRNVDSYNLPQTGAQMWCLIRAFPFLFGDLVPRDEKFMKLISLLNQIMVILFSHAISDYDLNNLEQLIVEHHRLFQDLFPGIPEPLSEEDGSTATEEAPTENLSQVEVEAEVEEEEDDPDAEVEVILRPEEVFEEFDGVEIDSEIQQPSTSTAATPGKKKKKKKRKPKVIRMINKHHHMLHYCDQIRMFGPLVLYWCMRYEARHYIFKLAATVGHNFINILKTLMEMLQMKTAADKNSSRRRMEMGKRGTKLVTVCDLSDALALISLGLEPSSKIFKVDHVKFNGVDYRKGLYVTLERSTQGSLPVFACIKNVYVSHNEDSVYLITQQAITECFEPLYCGYVVYPQNSAPMVAKAANDFPLYRLLAPWKRYDSQKLYLVPRTIA